MNRRLILPILLLSAGLAAVYPTERSLRSYRREITKDAEGEGWVRYVMVCLGGFRGVISEVLWIRATELQDQGRYFELVQLADWITALDPRAADAWVFNAWNLSYNVPAMLPDPKARLNWVNAGIDLLRNKAIRANPTNPRLYRELGWLYQNKIGSDDDAASRTYKLHLASMCPDGRPASDALTTSVVKDIESTFGALDWRLPESHAVYWAWQGLAHAQGGFEREALRRMVRQNVFTMIQAGRFTGNIEHDIYATEPNYDLAAGLITFCENTLREDPGDATIYAMTLARLVQILHEGGREDEGRKAYARFASLLGAQQMQIPPYEAVLNGAGQTRGKYP